MTGASRAKLARSQDLTAAAAARGLGEDTPRRERNEAIIGLLGAGATATSVARLFGISTETVSHVRKGSRLVQLSPREYAVIKAMREGRATISTTPRTKGDDHDE